MKAYKLEILVIDHDHLGKDELLRELENARFPNDCVRMDVKRVEEADIGQWHDDHPLNKRDTAEMEYHRLFDPLA